MIVDDIDGIIQIKDYTDLRYKISFSGGRMGSCTEKNIKDTVSDFYIFMKEYSLMLDRLNKQIDLSYPGVGDTDFTNNIKDYFACRLHSDIVVETEMYEWYGVKKFLPPKRFKF